MEWNGETMNTIGRQGQKSKREEKSALFANNIEEVVKKQVSKINLIHCIVPNLKSTI